jgi:glycosyltransferase involved in cell wall biosynthesis
MGSLKILFTLSHAFSPTDGGVQRTTYKLGQYFTDHGFEVFYYSLASTGHYTPEKGTLFFPDVNVPRNSVSLGNDVYELIKKLQPEIIINQMPYENIFRDTLKKYKSGHNCFVVGCLRNSLFSFKSNAEDILLRNSPAKLHRIVTSKPGLMIMQQIHRIKHRKQLKEIIEVHDKFVLLTPRNEDELKYFLTDYDKSKIDYIPNSIPYVHQPSIPKKKQVLFVGNLNVHQKRADLLLLFWKRVYDKLPDWNFLIVGDGDYRPKMEALIEKESIPRVTLVGRTNPEKYYNESSVFIMTSAFEGFPNVLLEAQSFGLVSIVINSYLSLSWIANENADTFFSDPFDVEDMSNKCIALCNNETMLEQMSKKALENAGRFTIDKVGRMWIDFFKKNLMLKVA